MNKKAATWIWIVIGIIVIGLIVGAIFLNNDNSGSNTTSNPTSNTGENQQTPTTSSQPHNIEIKNFAFSPSTLNIKKGDTVIWTNMDSVGHTVTSDSGSELDSALLSDGQTYSHTFNTAGTFSYHCVPHPYMKGTVIVE